MKADTAEPIKPIQRNGVTIRIRRTEKNGFGRFVVDYRVLGQRKLVWRSSLADARAAANDAIDKITAGQGEVLNLKSADAYAYTRARAILDGDEGETKIDFQIDEAVREFADAYRLLAGRSTIGDVCREWLKRNAVELPKISVAAAVEELKKLELADGQSNDRMKQFNAHLNPLAVAFNGEVHTITPKLIADYLGAMAHGERTKANHRDTIGYFNRWLILRGYLPKGTDWLEGVREYSKRKIGKIEVLSADEMRRLIEAADERILPLVVIGGFAGLRHEEIKRLDWQDIDLDEGFIEVKAANSKTGTRRAVPMKENLKAFLKPLAKKSGKVVTVENTTKQLLKAEAETGDGWKRNSLRHSYISARLAECGDEARVAYEAGNSPQVIRSNYDARIRPKAATEWFSISPKATP
ncbi:MAG TPA: site-specific integrase [Verrucomicrobiae bacterium]